MIEKIPNTSQTHSYCRCGACGRILPEAEWAKAGVDTRTPCCGASGIEGEAWPSPAVTKLLETASCQDVDSPEQLQLAAVFLCFAVENIIESILIGRAKTPQGASRPSCPALENGRGFESLALAFEKVCGESLADRFENLGGGDFMTDISQLFTLRDKLAREPGYKARQSERKAVLAARYWCLKYFTLLNNNLCTKTAVKKAAPAARPAAARTKSVLVVDDELVVLDFMCRLVRRQGLDVFGAATGLEGIKLFRENEPDCVLLDIALPDMDGLSVLKEIREINPAAVVHMVTGIGGEAIEKQAKKLGTRSYISKPIDPGVLIDIIKNI